MVGTMPVADIRVGERHRKEMGDLDALAASIREVGLLHPPVVLADGTLIAGERRLAAVRKIGWVNVPVTVVSNLTDTLLCLQAQSQENTCRLAFTPEEFASIGKDIYERLAKPAAKERQQKGKSRDGKAGGRGKRKPRSEKPTENFPEGFFVPPEESEFEVPAGHPPETGKAWEAAAAAVGVSAPTLKKAIAVVEAAEAEPDNEAVQKARRQMNKTGKVNGAHKQVAVARAAADIRAEPPPLPTGPFRVIIADPPWSYDNRPDDPSHRASNPYPSMSLEEIKGLPVGGIAHDDCILWLWTTNSHMPHAFDILQAWGFTHKTILTWVKSHFGTGDWLRGQTEHCILAVRGKPVVTLTNQATVINGPLRAHSEKPDEFYDLVKSLCPTPERGTCELFQRTPREGIIGHGNEV